MKKSLCLVVSLLFAPFCANAGPMYLQLTESDPGGPNTVVLRTYDSLVENGASATVEAWAKRSRG